MSSNTVQHVSTPTLLLSALPLICVAYTVHRLKLGVENTLLIGIVRSFTQLSILGLILQPIFTLGLDKPWLVGLYLLFMSSIATKESISRPKYTFKGHALKTFIVIFITISIVATFAFIFIIQPIPLWNPQYVIPISGMLMGNCISGASLTVNNLTTQILEGGQREIELYLSFGATGYESVSRLIRNAVKLGCTPLLNSLNVIGLVSIPGMMTGQILGGSDVGEAAHYQILIIYLNSTCNFLTIFGNVMVLYNVAFDTRSHTLRIDRFTEVVKNITMKERLQSCGEHMKALLCCYKQWKKRLPDTDGYNTPLQYGSSNSLASNRIEILTRKLNRDGSENDTPIFQISKLQFSVPKSHKKRKGKDSQSSSLPPSPLISSSGNGFTQNQISQQQQQQQQQRVLCTDLNLSLYKGEIGIVRGPSGAGKSTLLRVLSGLTKMDDGDVITCGMSLAACGESIDMVQWRTRVRYVTQYKVDIPGTPRDFIHTVTSLKAYAKSDTPTENEMIEQTLAYLDGWGMGEEDTYSTMQYQQQHHPYLDKEWKALSGGECQRTLLAIALASRARVLLLDESTSGLDHETERHVEESIVEYVRANGAVVLWVTHSDDISDRLLSI